MLEAQASDPKGGLMRLYGNAALLALPDTIADALQAEKKTDKKIRKVNEILDRTHVKLRDADERDNAVSQIINQSVAEQLLFWSNPRNQQEWQLRHPDVDWQQVATTLLTEAFTPTLQNETAGHLVRLCSDASNLSEMERLQDELLNVADEDERKRLQKPPFGEAFFDALLVVRGIASFDDIGESVLREEIEAIQGEVEKAYKHRAKQYGYLIDDTLRKKDASLDTELSRLREKARHCWIKAGLSEEEADQKVTAKRKNKKPFSDSNVSAAKEKQAEIEAGAADWQAEPAAYIDCEGAEEVLVAKLEDKAEKTAISYIRKISKALPDPFRELKMARRMVRKHGNMHEGFIKEWNDFDAILTHTIRHLQQAQFMLGLHPEQSQQKGAFPLSEPYASFQQAMQHIQQHYAESVRDRLKEKGLPFSETTNQEHIRWDIDLTPLLAPEKKAERNMLSQHAEPTGWEEGWERHFVSGDTLLADVPESLQASLKPLTDVIEAFSKLGQVSIPEITLKIDAHGESEAMILEAVQSIFEHSLNPMAHKMGHDAVPELSYNAETQTLQVRFSMDQAASIVQTAAFVAGQHQALNTPGSRINHPVNQGTAGRSSNPVVRR